MIFLICHFDNSVNRIILLRGILFSCKLEINFIFVSKRFLTDGYSKKLEKLLCTISLVINNDFLRVEITKEGK